jgi:kynurenine formamidase
MRRLVTAALLALGACRSSATPNVGAPPEPAFREGFVVVDLTRPLDATAPFVPHPNSFPFERLEFTGPRTFGWRTGGFSCLDHMGTHVSAPLARLPGGTTVDKLPAGQLVGPLVVLDLPASAKDGGVVTSADVLADERSHGPVPSGSIVVLRTGRGAMASSDPALLGKRADGTFSFPGWGDDAVRLLAVERRVRAIGTDGPAIDSGANWTAAPAQSTGSVGGLWFVVGLADLSKLPARGATLVVGALPVAGAPGAPARVLALVPPKAQ